MRQNRNRLAGFILLLLGAVLTGPAWADAGLRVEGAFARATPGLARNGVVFMAIHNPGAAADRLIGVEAAVSGRAELHTHIHEGGTVRMRPVPAIEIPAKGMAELVPGGDHVMLFSLKAPLREGDEFPLTLIFEVSEPLAVTVKTLSVGAQKMPESEDESESGSGHHMMKGHHKRH